MSSAKRPPSGDAPRQPWTPDAAPKGVTCPACGLANEPGARTCRNCGLPIAAASDPVRGVTPGHVDLPRARRSGFSATLGFVLVIGLLLVGGTLAVSGGGILSTGGRLGFGTEATPTPRPAATIDPVTGEVVTPSASGDPVAEVTPKAKGTSFAYTCENNAIKDLSRGKWQLNEVQAGLRTEDDGTKYDQVYWKLSRTNKKKVAPGKATTVSMLWMTPKEAQEKFDISRVRGDRALVVTFNGPVSLTANRTIEQDDFEHEGIDQVGRLQLFEGKDGKLRTVIGIRSESCARMKAPGWTKKSTSRNARVTLDIERFD